MQGVATWNKIREAKINEYASAWVVTEDRVGMDCEQTFTITFSLSREKAREAYGSIFEGFMGGRM